MLAYNCPHCRASLGSFEVLDRRCPHCSRELPPHSTMQPVSRPGSGFSGLLSCCYDGPSVWMLTIGQAVVILAALGIVVGVLEQLQGISQAQVIVEQVNRQGTPNTSQALDSLLRSRVFVIGGGIITIGLCSALFVVFGQAKAVNFVARQQDCQNDELWDAIRMLHKEVREGSGLGEKKSG